jgi:4-hydroxythreonine-4-phosphate dehydrogenase
MKSKRDPTSKFSKIKVGITIGDPAGIGAEIILKALTQVRGLADFVVIGDSVVLNRLSVIGYRLCPAKFIDLNNIAQRSFRFGKIKAEYGRAAIGYLDKAIDLIRKKEIDCLVTCPVSKEAVSLTGRHFNGQTEYLAKKTASKDFAMMLLNERLKFALITRHIPLKEVAAGISQREILRTAFLVKKELKRLFLFKSPRIVFCGLNPHASDNGLLGREENRVIKPALAKLKKMGWKNISGPLAADVAISSAYRGDFDCVIAMYHDQALIPLKLSGRNCGVNLTLGLPFVRTSPLHGTAFDIAGKDIADPSSLIAAINLAVKCARNLKKD